MSRQRNRETSPAQAALAARRAAKGKGKGGNVKRGKGRESTESGREESWEGLAALPGGGLEGSSAAAACC